MVLQWIDRFAGLAYVYVRGPLSAFGELLKGIDKLIADPNWHAGMAILEDLRDYEGDPQPDALERWRAYVAERGPRLQGCRWAVVRRADNPALTSVLDTAAQDATKAGVTLRQFTSTVDAHAWLSQASGVAVVLLACG